jgi:hypothetical protein
MNRLAAFDPRTRSLSGLRAFDPRIRSLSGFGGRGIGCTECSRTVGLGRLSRMARLGDDSTFADNIYLDTGVVLPQPGTIATSDASYPSTLGPAPGVNYGALSPQQQVAQAAYGTTNLLQLSPAQSAAIMAAVSPSASGVPALTAAQIAAIRSAAPPGVSSGTILGIPTSYFLWGGVGLVALSLLGSGKRR